MFSLPALVPHIYAQAGIDPSFPQSGGERTACGRHLQSDTVTDICDYA
jgi:hypothetical protein